MNTKERILEEALTLFSVRGFKGTSVKCIADAVGIKDSSLYKHFSSKQEILNTIVTQMRLRISQMSLAMGIPEESSMEEAAVFFSRLSMDGLKKISRKIFLFYLTDSYISRFWRLANMEQYQNPDIYDIFYQLFLEESIDYQALLFQAMIRQGGLKKVNPRVLALSFYAPIFFLLNKYSSRPENAREALVVLDRQVEEFYRNYHQTGNVQQ